MSFHIIIAEERRKAPRQLAQSISADLIEQTGVDAKGMPVLKVTPRPAQLHTMGENVGNYNDPNLLYIAEWDLVSPYIIVHKGKIADLKMQFAGWPLISQTDWESLQLKEPTL